MSNKLVTWNEAFPPRVAEKQPNDTVTKSVRKPPKGGSRKGIPNKATQNAREAIATFVDGNADRLAGWLDSIAADSPEKAFRCFMDVVEYHVPKLARTELTGENGGALNVVVKKLTLGA